jgi:hypothetical protein
MIDNSRITAYESQLNDFDLDIRRRALGELLSQAATDPALLEPERQIANMHCHTFYSFNAYGHSPTSLAWLAKRHGFALIGMVDFDVLDAVDEFFAACDRAGVRGSAGLETRAYVPEFATREINSPGEPGVYYHMGIGFASSVVPAAAAPILSDLRARAARRNRELVARVNAYLDPVKLDYDKDVVPLTPSGNATERHIVTAYLRAAERKGGAAAFWSEKLGVSHEQMDKLLMDAAKMQNTVRSKLMKQGGVGYVQPDAGSFPTVEPVHQLIEACGAIPCVTWLDGTSAGEQAMPELLELLVGKGGAALNIVPDRNWNIADAAQRAAKVKHLYDVVSWANDFALPLNIGTEMNSYGQKLVDDFDAPELAPVREAFIDGAYFIYGHTVLQRAVGLGFQSEWAKGYLPERRDRNAFYTRAGRALRPGQVAGLGLTSAWSPADILAKIELG